MGGTIVEKGIVINNELARQDGILSKKMDEIDQVTQTLNGMRSLGRKVKNTLKKKEPKLNMKEFDNKTSYFSTTNLDLLEDTGICPISKLDCSSSAIIKGTSGGMQQIRIKAGMEELHKALDVMAVQQMDLAWALNTQEGRLSVLGNRMVTSNKNLNRVLFSMQ